MKNLMRNTMLTLVLGAFLLSPVFASAESNGKSKEEKNQAKIEKQLEKQTKQAEKKAKKEAKQAAKKLKNEKKSCVRAWGHLIASGWLKNNDPINYEISENCFMPFGIAKKFGGTSATTTPDITSPVISSIIATVSTSSAKVFWQTNEPATSKVFYSTTSPVNLSASTTAFVASSTLVNLHMLNITNLATSTTYFVVVQSRDASLNTATSSQFSFTTAP